MWIVFGTKESTRRVSGGLKVERECGQCGEWATFYEKEVTSTFRLYFIDVLDYGRQRVMACGCCGACYATDELGAPETRARGEASPPAHEGLPEGARRAAGRVGEYVDRAADAIESGISSLFFDERGKAGSERDEAPPARSRDDEDDPLVDPLEARFRELERKARIRID